MDHPLTLVCTVTVYYFILHCALNDYMITCQNNAHKHLLTGRLPRLHTAHDKHRNRAGGRVSRSDKHRNCVTVRTE